VSRWFVLGAALLIGGGPLSFISCQSPALTAGKLYLKQQKFDLALQQLELAVSQESTSADAYYHLGRAYGLAGYHIDMVAAFDRSLMHSRKYEERMTEERLYYWTRMYNDGVRIAAMSHPDLVRASGKFRIAAKIIPDRLQAWRNLGFTLYSIGEIDEAISSFEFVTQFAQSDTATLNALGTLYLGESRDEEAIVQFEKALVHSEQLVTLTNLAVALSRVGDIVASEETYRRALVIDSTHWQSYYNLGSLYWQQSRFDESVEAFEHAVRLNPVDVDARYNLAVAYLGLDRVDDAFPLLETLSLDMPDHGLVWRGLGRAYANRGMDAESADAFAKASALGQ